MPRLSNGTIALNPTLLTIDERAIGYSYVQQREKSLRTTWLVHDARERPATCARHILAVEVRHIT